jgi:phosphohistidine phosphatase
MDLYIIRHAWAADRDEQWPDDDLRPLTKEGQERFAQVVARLAPRVLTPEIVGTSPLVRCVQTAHILAAGVSGEPQVVQLDELRPGSSLGGVLAWTARQSRKYQRIAWVGHAPDVDRMTAALIGSPDSLMRFAKGSIAAIRFDGPLVLGGGELQWLVTAKVLGC